MSDNSFDLERERDALYEVLTIQPAGFVSQKQVQVLASLVAHGLKDKSRSNRIAVMKYLVGDAVQDSCSVEFHSFKNMTSGIASKLIDLFLEPDTKPWRLSKYGQQLISAAESEVKAHAKT